MKEGLLDADWSELDHPEFVDWDLPSQELGLALQRRQPTSSPEPAHFHPSIEINFLMGCDMTYSFSGKEVEVMRGRFCVFWAAHPHRKMSVRDSGEMTNIYVSLSEFLQWSLPMDFVNALLSGSVLSTQAEIDGDSALARRLANEVENTSVQWQRLHSQEVQAWLSRMAVEGWVTLHTPMAVTESRVIGGKAIQHFEKMLRFVAVNFASRITVADIAGSAGVSQSHAVSLFGKMLGRTIMEHIRDMRIVHAKMLLVETEHKILTIAMDCGFGSLSSFYQSFQDHVGVSPAVFRKNPSASFTH